LTPAFAFLIVKAGAGPWGAVFSGLPAGQNTGAAELTPTKLGWTGRRAGCNFLLFSVKVPSAEDDDTER
jgi:hypothetical protein